MNYIDMHCDTLAEALARGQKNARSLEGTMVDVERLKRSGAMAQFFAMFLPQKESDRRKYQAEAGGNCGGTAVFLPTEPGGTTVEAGGNCGGTAIFLPTEPDGTTVEAGGNCGGTAIFLPTEPDGTTVEAGRNCSGTPAGGEKQEDTMPQLGRLMEHMYEIYQNTLSECSGVLAPAYGEEDLEKNRTAGKISAFLTIENGVVAAGKLENIQRFYEMGVRLITLTWNDENCFGFPHSSQREKMQLGLKPFGKEAVSYMEEQGILVDVSHLSDGGFYDVADIIKKPFVASHSNCRALAPATRNLTDSMIRILAQHGGVAGINFAPAFLNRHPKAVKSSVERMCDHVEHFIRIGGVECVGIGTDFDGIEGEFEIPDCTYMEKLFAALQKRGISEGTLEKIAYRNVERVIREAM